MNLQILLAFVLDATWFGIQTLCTELYYTLTSVLPAQRPSSVLQSAPPKTLVLTGGSSGIGFEITKQWLAAGGRCVVLSRSAPKLQNAKETQLDWIHCDLASFSSTKAAAKKVLARCSGSPISSFIFCAGVMMPDVKLKSLDQHDLSLQVNHLSHALLSLELAQLAGPKTSILFVSSVAHVAARGILDLSQTASSVKQAGSRGMTLSASSTADKLHSVISGSHQFSASAAYAESKLSNVIWARALSAEITAARGACDSPLLVASIHPGVVDTRLYQHLPGVFAWLQQAVAPWLFRAPSTSASQILAVATGLAGSGRHGAQGAYFVNGQLGQAAGIADDAQLHESLLDFTCGAIGISRAVLRSKLRLHEQSKRVPSQ
jgi:NAD(P)-dependent dehydrogenase (short-subunit alcohol dehydrogenase family)